MAGLEFTENFFQNELKKAFVFDAQNHNPVIVKERKGYFINMRKILIQQQTYQTSRMLKE